MLLPLLTVCCLSVGSYALLEKEECYGGDFWLPSLEAGGHPLSLGKMFFTPTNPTGPKKLVMEDGEVKDARYRKSDSGFSLLDVMESDEGIFSMLYFAQVEFDVFKLKVLDCSDKDYKTYGKSYSCRFSKDADFLEFTPLHRLDQPRILWNRTDPQASRGGRGQVDRNLWKMMDVTQADNGHYNFRRKDNKLVTRKKLTVTENTESYKRLVDENILITFALDPALCTVTFTNSSEMRPIEVMKAGRVPGDYDWQPGNDLFYGRIQRKFPEPIEISWGLGFEIEHLTTSDSGRFEVRDQNSNLALVVNLTVNERAPVYWRYIGVGVGAIFKVLICWCCVRTCWRCCKKSSSKRDSSAPQTVTAPAVYYHDDASQPSGRSYPTAPYVAGPSYPTAPNVPGLSYQPPPYLPTYTHEPTPLTAPWSLDPPTSRQELLSYSKKVPGSNPGPSQVPASGGPPADPSFSLGSDCLSSNPEPQFYLKGLSSPSALPLSSDHPNSHVYNSKNILGTTLWDNDEAEVEVEVEVVP